MDSKQSFGESQSDRNKFNLKIPDQSSIQCLTDPTRNQKDISHCSISSVGNTEVSNLRVPRSRDDLKKKEASALEYLRDLSEQEYNNNIEAVSGISQLDTDQDPLNTSDNLSPFEDPVKPKTKAPVAASTAKVKVKQAQTHTHTQTQQTPRLLTVPNSVNSIQLKIRKEHKKKELEVKKEEQIKREEHVKKERSKRVRSEPNEDSRILQAMKSKPFKFEYPKAWSRGGFSKMHPGINFPEDEHFVPYDKREKGGYYPNIATEPDQRIQLTLNLVNKMKGEDILPNINDLKGRSVLQLSKLFGYSYSQLLQDMRDFKGLKTERDVEVSANEDTSKLPISKSAEKKAFYPREKRLAKGVSQFMPKKRESIMLVGRSLSVSKLPLGADTFLEKDFGGPELSAVDSANKEDMRLSEYDEEKDDMGKEEESRWTPSETNVSGREVIKNESLQRKGIRKDSECSKEFSKKDSSDSDTILVNKPSKRKSKSDVSKVMMTERAEAYGQQIMEKNPDEMQIGIWFKAKKNMINPTFTEEDITTKNRSSSPGVTINRDGGRKLTRSKENKGSVDSLSRILKSKMDDLINKQKSSRNSIILPELSEALRIKAKPNNINFIRKEQKVFRCLNNKETLLNFFARADDKTRKVPKLKPILNEIAREIGSKSERLIYQPKESLKTLNIEEKSIQGLQRKQTDNLPTPLKGPRPSVNLSRLEKE